MLMLAILWCGRVDVDIASGYLSTFCILLYVYAHDDDDDDETKSSKGFFPAQNEIKSVEQQDRFGVKVWSKDKFEIGSYQFSCTS